MYQLWGRNVITRQYELITNFDDERQFYYMLDQVDKSMYYEVMITQGQDLKLYFEIEKTKTR